MLQVRGMRLHCANVLVVLRICASLGGALVAENALCWQEYFFTHKYKPGVGKLVQWMIHLQKNKNTCEPQNWFVLSIQIR